VGALAVVVVTIGVWALRQSGAAPAVLGRPRVERPVSDVARIDLARLDAPHGESEAGRRDLFAFGSAWDLDAEPPPPPMVVATPPPVAARGAEGIGPATPGLPSLNLKYIGSVESKAGVKVAVLLTDRREVLTGQAGQVVANRYRIARIGLESVDLEDVGSGLSRRIPLKGN
jgi:hypothetical protein